MTKELEKELFNIYDVVVFEDENGITQDCVCAIGKDKEVNKIFDEIECNNHDITIYENGSYKVWEKNGKNLPYYATNKKIIHLYTLKNDNRYYEVYPTNDCEAIDQANPSEALESLEEIIHEFNEPHYELSGEYSFRNELLRRCENEVNIIKQALLKAQEQEKENELLKEIIKSFFDRGCPLHQYINSKGELMIEVDDECSTMILGEYKGVDLDKKLKEVLECQKYLKH